MPIADATNAARLFVIMGVSGSGKSTLGALLAGRLGVAFLDADNLHSVSSINKMTAGIPLNDDDRLPWLRSVGLALAIAGKGGLVVACSALRHSYRSVILESAPATRFLLLQGSRELLLARLQSRAGHFMPETLLDSQLATLENLTADEAGTTLSLEELEDPNAIVDRALRWIVTPERS
jgi:gluconokinase